MAVIITNMDMPKCCGDCPFLKSGYGHCELGIKIAFLSKKASDCPLKSADEMISEIEDEYFDVYVFAREITTRDGILKIIHKYCDKESEKK